ncbi:MAG: molybdopterin-dependent oxidoreductase, partial [Thermodesulfobacteriota bacterium]|nr:molybdopterin-dependent oxidoreductase [Thermodesulfobacteriota bacterium]
LCLKGNNVLGSIYHPARIFSPLSKKDDGTFEEISWDEALDTIASQIKKIGKKHGSDSLAFLTSPCCTNEENYLLQKFARILGTNNVDCPSFYEGDVSISDSEVSLGSSGTTNPFADLVNADCIIISGSNFLENHPIVSREIFEAKARGASIVCIDHRAPSSLLLSNRFLQIEPGTQALLIDGMIAHILEKKLFNKEFVEEHTSGFSPFQKAMAKHSLKNSEKVTGIPAAHIKEVAEQFAFSKASALVHAIDYNASYGNHNNTIVNLTNLALLCGQLGRPGTGVYPLPQHSNAQGTYDMGVTPHALPGQNNLKDQSGKIAKLWKVKNVPSKEGLSLPAMAKKSRRIKALYVMEANPLAESVYADQLRKTLKGLDLLVVQDCFMTETAQLADIILPAASWAEKTGTYTNAERRVQWQSKIINPQQEIIPNWQVICSIAKKLGFKKQFSFSNTEAILTEITKIIPAYSGISPNRVKKSHGITHPCPTSKHPGTPILYTEGFTTPDGRGTFIPVTYEKKMEKPTVKYPFHLTFGKTTLPLGMVAREEDSALSEQVPALLVEINSKDAKKVSVQNNSEVKIITKEGSISATARITDRVLPGVVFVPFCSAGGNGFSLTA